MTKNEYDLAGQLKKVTYAFGTADAASVEYTYDLAGRRLTEKDERGNVTTSGYDDAGRLVSVTNAQGKVKTFGYDDADRRTSSTDEKNRTTVFEFDGRGRNTKVTYPDGKFVTQVFVGLNRLTSRTDQDNKEERRAGTAQRELADAGVGAILAGTVGKKLGTAGGLQSERNQKKGEELQSPRV